MVFNVMNTVEQMSDHHSSGLQGETWSCSLLSSRPASTLDDGRPVLPLLGNLSQNTAHDTRRSHKTVTFALENSHLAASHSLAQPLDIFDGHASVLASVVDHGCSCNIHVAESDGLATFQADQKINGGIGISSGQRPNLMSESSVIVPLPLQLFLGRLGARSESCIAFSIRCMGDIRRLGWFGGRDSGRLGLNA